MSQSQKQTRALIAALLFVPLTARPEPALAASALLDVFPAAKAPTFYEQPSEFVVSRQFRPGTSRSQWAAGVDERAVFHAYLTHKSTAERSWELRLGQGGQLYSIVSLFGEAMPPQSVLAPFVDEVWQMVAINSDLLDRMPELGKMRSVYADPAYATTVITLKTELTRLRTLYGDTENPTPTKGKKGKGK